MTRPMNLPAEGPHLQQADCLVTHGIRGVSLDLRPIQVSRRSAAEDRASAILVSVCRNLMGDSKYSTTVPRLGALVTRLTGYAPASARRQPTDRRVTTCP